MKSTFKIGGLQVDPGSRKRGILSVGPYFSHRRAYIRKRVRIPFTVVNGIDDGPVFCVTGGVHPTEYAGISAAIRLSNDLDPKTLKGAVVIIPVVNIPGYEERTYICPIDGINLNTVFPGRPDGTIGHLITYSLVNEFIKKANYYIDLHGGDIHESMLGHCYFCKTGVETIDAKSEGIARALGFKYIAVNEGVGSSLRAAADNGIPAALCEFNQGDRLLLDQASKIFEGLLNVLRYIKIIDGEPFKIEGQELLKKTEWVTVEQEGLLHTQVKPGDWLSEGEIIGEIKDLYGNVAEELRSPCKGVVLFMIHNPKVEPGERLIQVIRVDV